MHLGGASIKFREEQGLKNKQPQTKTQEQIQSKAMRVFYKSFE
jgi:hypothetical protein